VPQQLERCIKNPLLSAALHCKKQKQCLDIAKQWQRDDLLPFSELIYSHSMVLGGLLVMSYTTRLTLRTCWAQQQQQQQQTSRRHVKPG
jgi:hypothetical protein